MIAGDARACLQKAPLRTILVGPAAPGALGDGVERVEGAVVVGVVLFEGFARGGGGGDGGRVDVADVVEHWDCEGRELGAVACGGEEFLDGGGQGGGGWVQGGVGGHVAAVLAEGRVVDGRVPVAALPAADAGGEDVGEVVVVGEGLQAEGGFEGGSQVGAVLVEEDVVDDVGEELGPRNTGLGTVFADGFVVVPVVPDGFGDARGGYRTCGISEAGF